MTATTVLDSTAAEDSILFAVSDDGLARMTFNRPARLNAMDFAMAERWREIAHRVADDPGITAVILDAARAPGFDIEKLKAAMGKSADIH